MTRSNVLLLGFTVPDEVARQLFVLDTSPSVQTHKFGWCLARSLRSGFGNLVLASSCPIQSYPLGRKIIFRGKQFKTEGMDGVLLGFINLIVLKHLTRFLSCLVVLPRLIIRNHVNWLFIHGIHTPYLLFGLLARLFGVKLAVVLTDPPGVILATDSVVARVLKRVDVRMVSWALSHADAIIALAPELVQRFAVNKPALVFPGILDSSLANIVQTAPLGAPSGEPFTILYAGGLSQAYGVDRLIDAVISIVELPVRLKLFGRGDQESRIRELAANDSRFFYGGFVGSEQLVPELLRADVLVNPRPTHEEFSVMSFPSKLIEYLAIGRPVLTTRIASIPVSYRENFFFIDDESPNGMREAILALAAMPNGEREGRASRGRNFIVSEASEYAVGEKIADFVCQRR